MIKPYPIIKTPRLILRVPELQDAESLNNAVVGSLHELHRWGMLIALDPSLQGTTKCVQDNITAWNANKPAKWIVIDKENQQIIGHAGYNNNSDVQVPFYEISYWIRSDYVNKGLATEITNALTQYALIELRAARVQLCIDHSHIASIRVAEKCNYIREAVLKSIFWDNIAKKPTDACVFACFDIKDLPPLDVNW